MLNSVFAHFFLINVVLLFRATSDIVISVSLKNKFVVNIKHIGSLCWSNANAKISLLDKNCLPLTCFFAINTHTSEKL